MPATFSIRTLLTTTFLVGVVLAIWQYNLYLKAQSKRDRQQAIELVFRIPNALGLGPNDSICDPTAIPNAAASLRKLGKNEALLALEEFAVQHPERAHYATIRVILPYVFEPDKIMPTPADLFSIENGLVFFTYPFDFTGSFPVHHAEDIQWAKTSGKLRNSEIIPSGNPSVAADNLLAKISVDPYINENDWPYYQPYIYRQVHSCTHHLLNSNSQFKTDAPVTNAEWTSFKREITQIAPVWNAVNRTFMATK